MPSSLAALLWFVLLLLLFRYDPAKDPESPKAIWVPVIWIFFVASRLPSQWLGTQIASLADAFQEGNSLDRTIESVLILLAIGILVSRSFRWGDFITRNLAFVAYLSFALMSVLWSDFAFVSFKRWLRDLGSCLMILVVLSDHRPLEVVRTLLRRLCYLMIPLSIVLIKYFDSLGRHYDEWTGMATYTGVTTGKNQLGVLCLVSGVFFFWDTLTRWSEPQKQRSRWIFVNFSFMAMTLYLLRLSHSATSAVCMVLGCLVIAAAYSKAGRRNSTALKAAIPLCFLLYITLGFGLGLNATLAEFLGRDPTLTDRTKIWSMLLALHTNPLVGTGYESFWLGSRLDSIWNQGLGHISEAHNGYLEVYLNLGTIGLVLLLVFLAAAYKNICRKQLASPESLTLLSLAAWPMVVFYNITEAAFRHGLMWMLLLLGAIALPSQAEAEAPDLVGFDDSGPSAPVPSFPWQISSERR